MLVQQSSTLDGVDIDLLKDYADLMHKMGQVNFGAMVMSSKFSESIVLFATSLEQVNSDLLNQVLV